jgi:beta-glucanase (GH16 family)
MFTSSRHVRALLALAAALATGLAGVVPAAESLPLIDLSAPGIAARCSPSVAQVTFGQNTDPVAPGLSVAIAAGDSGYPGIGIKPDGAAWDLSSFGHVEARIANTGAKELDLNLRLDNAGDWQKDPWNTESIRIKPGETGTAAVIFGYQYGLKPGYKLDPSKVVHVLLFTGKVTEPVSFRIESLTAAGPAGETPPVKPDDVRIRPLDGYLLGGSVKLDLARQVEARDGATAEVVTEGDSQALRVALAGNRDSHLLLLRPALGRWDLTRVCEVRLSLRNLGAVPVSASLQMSSDGANGTDTVAADAPLQPGAVQHLALHFAPAVPWQGPVGELTKTNTGGQKGTGTRFASDKVDAARVTFRHAGEAVILIEAIQALPTPQSTPEWLGQRPPVEGAWAMTFRDEFDGTAIDRERWNIYTENYWDKASHFSKDNLIVGDGVVRLRLERKTGPENDDPKRKSTPYAVGFLDASGKWAQRYGYFEARMKLPTAPGLWPAFWLMPDRGPTLGPQWKRGTTGEGGMEFDIMEHLTRWGPYRYNIAMHWDGYEKDHKALGCSEIYIQPDADGFITCGLLWTPGSVVYYGNGVPVLRWDHERISNVPSYPILYLVTGGWDNSAVDDSQLPADFVVDYVRIWQRQDLASSLDGKIPPADKVAARNRPGEDGVILATAGSIAPADLQPEGAELSLVERDGTRLLQAQFPVGQYPAFGLPVAEGGWDLSGFAGAQLDVTNTGAAAVTVALRIDNLGNWQDNPWNTESATLAPGASATIKVTFGKSYGGNPGFALDPARIVAFKVFATQPTQPATVVVRNLRAFRP